MRDLARQPQKQKQLLQNGRTSMKSNKPACRQGRLKVISYKFRNGFTIIELLVVMAIVVIISGVVGDAFFSSLKGGTKTTITNIAKESGDQAISTMENSIKGAVKISPQCLSGTGFTAQSAVTITNTDKSTTTYTCPATPGRIEIQVIPVAPTPTVVQFITSNSVLVTGCSFSCIKQIDAPAILKINFTVIQKSPNATYRPEEQVTIPFETSVVMRNITEN